MPARRSLDEQVYEAIRSSSRGVSFEIVTGGVRYKAVLQHKETRYETARIPFNWREVDSITDNSSPLRLLSPPKWLAAVLMKVSRVGTLCSTRPSELTKVMIMMILGQLHCVELIGLG